MTSYFTIKELCNSNVAKSKNIDNTPNENQINNLIDLINILNVIREEWGYPIKVNSGYRCPALNKVVGGSKTSHHLEGKAADLTTGNKQDNKALFNLIIKLQQENKINFTQLIDENNFSWVHLGVDKNNLKNQVLKINTN